MTVSTKSGAASSVVVSSPPSPLAVHPRATDLLPERTVLAWDQRQNLRKEEGKAEILTVERLIWSQFFHRRARVYELDSQLATADFTRGKVGPVPVLGPVPRICGLGTAEE